MTTDTSEKGLECLVCEALTGADCEPSHSGVVRTCATVKILFGQGTPASPEMLPIGQ